MNITQNVERAIFAGGCFWCTEAVFSELDGIQSIRAGYIGGHLQNPTYEQISNGGTGHAEAVEILFDPLKIDYPTLLRIFFATHDPTSINRQGNDVGTQYRSEIFYLSESQRQEAKEAIDWLNQANPYGGRLVTRLSPASVFYVADDHHQNYYSRNKNVGYCQYVIAPKVEKVRGSFAHLLK